MAQRIKRIEFKKKDKVYIELNKSSASKAANGIVNKNQKVTSDLQPHADFVRALERMTPHLLIAAGLATPDYMLLGKKLPMDSQYFKDWAWKDDERFGSLTLTGILVIGKETADAIRLIGYNETPQGGITPLKTPKIDLYKKGDGEWNYPLLDLIDTQFDTLMTEAEEFNNELKFAPPAQMDMFDSHDNVRKIGNA